MAAEAGAPKVGAAETKAAEIVCATCGGADLVAGAWGPLPVALDPSLAAALGVSWCRDCEAETRLVAAGSDDARSADGG